MDSRDCGDRQAVSRASDAHKLGVILRKLIGVGKPREWAASRATLAPLQTIWATTLAIVVELGARIGELMPDLVGASIVPGWNRCGRRMAPSSTGC